MEINIHTILFVKCTDLIQVGLFSQLPPFSVREVHPGSHMHLVVICLLSLLPLGQFLSVSLSFTTLTFLQSSGRLLY